MSNNLCREFADFIEALSHLRAADFLDAASRVKAARALKLSFCGPHVASAHPALVAVAASAIEAFAADIEKEYKDRAEKGTPQLQPDADAPAGRKAVSASAKPGGR